MDPIAFRMQNLNATLNATTTRTGSRMIAVLQAMAKLANWTPRPAASQLSDANIVTGRGVAITGPQGVIAEIQVNKQTGKITATQMYAVQDPGLTINPASIENQMSGNQIMAASRALVEEVTFSKTRVTSLDFVGYPIMRFKDTPMVSTAIVNRPDMPSSGAGGLVEEQPAAAIANAFFDATGVRIREAPMTPGRVRAVLKAAGVVEQDGCATEAGARNAGPRSPQAKRRRSRVVQPGPSSGEMRPRAACDLTGGGGAAPAAVPTLLRRRAFRSP